jgi:DNA-binding NarL/FixJ family response regulator
VLRLLGDGLGNKQIAARLDISEHTAKFHISSILGKLNVTSRTEAVSQGIRRGLIPI